MQYSSLIASMLAVASAAPLENRAISNMDMMTLQLAHYLENLEYALYSEGYQNYTDAQYMAQGFPAGFRENVGVIAQHEATHRDTLASILSANGFTPLPACTYTFPATDPLTFVDVANMITSGGIGAYLGGSEMLTDSAVLEEAAASILTVEARHDTFLRTGAGGSPFPTAFDTGLTTLWIFNLVQQFIVSCPMQLPGQVVLPKLSLTSPAPSPHLAPLAAGTPLAFQWDSSKFFVQPKPGSPLYIAIVNQNVSTPIFQEVTSTGANSGTVPLPEGVAGAAFAALTTFSGGLTLNQLSQFGTLAGPTEVIIS